MSEATSLPLRGRGVLLTRPAAQAAALTARLEALGAQVHCFPLIEILPLAQPQILRALAGRLAEFDLAFFVSGNAVAHALGELPRALWPAALRVATVGPGTARALHEAGFDEVLVPIERFDSEAVLELPAFAPAAVSGKRVLVLRGDGGRELLADTLRQRGARVEQVACYRRAPPAGDPAILLDIASQGRLHALSLTSSEGADNLAVLLGERTQPFLARLPVFVPHERIGERAARLGASQVVRTAAGDEALIEALVGFFAADGTQRPI